MKALTRVLNIFKRKEAKIDLMNELKHGTLKTTIRALDKETLSKCQYIRKHYYPDLSDEWFVCGVDGCNEEPVTFDHHFPYHKSKNRCSLHSRDSSASR